MGAEGGRTTTVQETGPLRPARMIAQWTELSRLLWLHTGIDKSVYEMALARLNKKEGERTDGFDQVVPTRHVSSIQAGA